MFAGLHGMGIHSGPPNIHMLPVCTAWTRLTFRIAQWDRQIGCHASVGASKCFGYHSTLSYLT